MHRSIAVNNNSTIWGVAIFLHKTTYIYTEHLNDLIIQHH